MFLPSERGLQARTNPSRIMSSLSLLLIQVSKRRNQGAGDESTLGTFVEQNTQNHSADYDFMVFWLF